MEYDMCVLYKKLSTKHGSLYMAVWHNMNFYTFHPVSYKYTTFFGLRPSSSILIQKY